MSSTVSDDECSPLSTNKINSQYKNRILIEEKMAALLIDSYQFPSNCDSNGVFFINNNLFAANRARLSIKFGITINAINKDFRHHKIKCVQSFPLKSSFNLSDIKGWKIFQHSNSDFTLDNILNKNSKFVSKWITKEPKNQRKPPCENKNIVKQIIEKDEKIDQEIKFFNNDEYSIFDCATNNTDIDLFSDISDVFSSDDNYFMYNF